MSSIIKFEPFRGFEQLSRRMNEIFGDLEKGVRFELGDFAPRVDISEDEANIYLHAELPGMAKEDVKLSISDDRVLSLRGEKKRNSETKDKNYVRIERSYGSFARSFALPENVNLEGVKASFDNGVLELSLPKMVPVKPKETQIEIA